MYNMPNVFVVTRNWNSMGGSHQLCIHLVEVNLHGVYLYHCKTEMMPFYTVMIILCFFNMQTAAAAVSVAERN